MVVVLAVILVGLWWVRERQPAPSPEETAFQNEIEAEVKSFEADVADLESSLSQ